MNPSKQQSITVGAGLIILGIVAWFGLWHLIWPAALVAGGVIAYRQRRLVGRTIEAVQAGIWCFGLALLFLFGFVWPGILFLAGLSILARGREFEIDDRVQSLFGQMARQRATSQALPTQHVPITTQPGTSSPQSSETSNTSETRRL